MTNEIVNAIAKGIKSAWGDGCPPIYVTQLRQGFSAPCFFIELIETHTEAGLAGELRGKGARYHDEVSFQIHYFPETNEGDGGNVRAMYDVIPYLGMAVEVITLADGSKVRGRDISHVIDDDVLHTSVIYDVFYYRVCETAPYMETLTQTQTTAKED